MEDVIRPMQRPVTHQSLADQQPQTPSSGKQGDERATRRLAAVAVAIGCLDLRPQQEAVPEGQFATDAPPGGLCRRFLAGAHGSGVYLAQSRKLFEQLLGLLMPARAAQVGFVMSPMP